jgi:hypothetical protein
MIALRRLRASSTYLPPPAAKQVGPLGLLCMLSTSNSSFLSNLTNLDSAEGNLPLPPPSAVSGGNKTASAQPAKPWPPANPSLHKRVVSWTCKPVVFLHGGEGKIDGLLDKVRAGSTGCRTAGTRPRRRRPLTPSSQN